MPKKNKYLFATLHSCTRLAGFCILVASRSKQFGFNCTRFSLYSDDPYHIQYHFASQYLIFSAPGKTLRTVFCSQRNRGLYERSPKAQKSPKLLKGPILTFSNTSGWPVGLLRILMPASFHRSQSLQQNQQSKPTSH